ncbi:MAG: GNAT family N-acetyltransferase [Microthrixaceae bacterium]
MAQTESDDVTGAYPHSWEADVVLADGKIVHVRPITPGDAPALREFHSRQSPESIYFRYFSPRPELSDRDVHHFTHVDHSDRVAFVALFDDQIIGVARYERYKGTDVAEVAFFVDDGQKGRGLATLLLEFLVAAGRERGVRRFVATTLPTNHRMLSVFAAAGYEVSSQFDSGVVEVGFDILPTEASLAAIDRRERRSEAASVRRLLEPSSVAVVGVGRDSGSVGADVFRNIVSNGFAGPTFAVNRYLQPVDDFVTLASVDEIPLGTDLAVLAIPAERVSEAVDGCGRRGVGAVVVLSAGFSESGAAGAVLERELIEVARGHGMRLLGPNCLGVLNTDPGVRLDASLSPLMPPHGRIGVMTETGTLAAAIIEHAVRMDLGISTFVAAGNPADVGPGDLLSYWMEDDRTQAMLLSLKGRAPLPRLVRAARAASLVKPVAALNTTGLAHGRSRGGSATERRSQAMFRQTGVMSVSTLEQLFDLGRILADQPVPAGSGVAIIGNSDGAIVLAANACRGSGLDVVELTSVDADGERYSNPVDLTFRASAQDFRRCLEVVASDARVDSVMVVYTPPTLNMDPEITEVILDTSVAHPEKTVVSTMLGAAGIARLTRAQSAGDEATRTHGVPIFRFPEDAAHALGHLASYRRWIASAAGSGLETPDDASVDGALTAISDAIGRVEESGSVTHLDHDEQELLLAAFDMEVAERRVVRSYEEALAASEAIGWPVVLKAAFRDRSTRSTASGVTLDIGDAGHLRLVWNRMTDVIGDRMMPAVVQRFIPSGVDIAVTVRREATGAGTIEVGLGGAAAIIGETELGVLPLGLADATSLVAGSPIAKVLTDPLDRVPVVGLVHRLGMLADSLDVEMSIRADPVVVVNAEAWVADIDVVIGEPLDDFMVRRLETEVPIL